jgi:phosphate transport system protein
VDAICVFFRQLPPLSPTWNEQGKNATGIAQLLVRMAPLRARGTSQVQINQATVADEGRRRPETAALTENSIVSGLLDLGQEAQRVLRGTMRAFEENDTHTARIIWQEDDVVDVRYHMVRHDLMTMLAGVHAIPALQQDALIMQRLTYWLWMAHKLERVGDHCTNICERTVFFLEGDTAIEPRHEQ